MAKVKCRWPGCETRVNDDEWACKTHMARLSPGLRNLLKETFDWQSIVIDGKDPDQHYVAVSEACRNYALDYNNVWKVFEGYKDGASAHTATDAGHALPRRRRRRSN